MVQKVLAVAVLSLIVLGLASCEEEVGKDKVSFAVLSKGSDEVLDFGADELATFLVKTGKFAVTTDVNNVDKKFLLVGDEDMKPYTFGVKAKGDSVVLKGADSTCVLHAVYTLLEELGYVLEVTGPTMPEELEMEKLEDMSIYIDPAVKDRGIREIINFPMDISSYPLEEAKEFVRNLARMRFNFINYHSYPGQWYEAETSKGKTLAGGLFYDQRHDIPDDPLLKANIRNDKVYFIPSIEPFYEDVEKRSDMAVKWMSELMDETKRAGLKISFSFEPRDRTTEIEDTIKTAEQIYEQYPQIDILEVITQEIGFWGPVAEKDEIREIVTEHYGEKTLEWPKVQKTVEFEDKRHLAKFYGELGHNIKAVNTLKEKWSDGDYPEPVIGLYCSVPLYLDAGMDLLRKFSREDVRWALLPAHGNMKTYKHLSEVELTKEDWERMLLSSWFEMDGIMYLQQNSLHYMEKQIEDALETLDGTAIPCIQYIHWRNAECRTMFRYGAVSAVDWPLKVDDFYVRYAEKYGIGDVENYVKAMNVLDVADQEAIKVGPSLGFCFVGCWPGGLSLYGLYDQREISDVRKQYEKSLGLLQECADSVTSREGLYYIAFLDNRIRATIVYLKGLERGTDLQDVVGDKKPEELTDEERKQVVKIVRESLAYMRQWMKIHFEMIADRGTEGNVISFYHTPIAELKEILVNFGRVEDVDLIKPDMNGVDVPPPPVIGTSN